MRDYSNKYRIQFQHRRERFQYKEGMASIWLPFKLRSLKFLKFLTYPIAKNGFQSREMASIQITLHDGQKYSEHVTQVMQMSTQEPMSVFAIATGFTRLRLYPYSMAGNTRFWQCGVWDMHTGYTRLGQSRNSYNMGPGSD